MAHSRSDLADFTYFLAIARIRTPIEAGKNDFPGLLEHKALREAKLRRSAPAPQR